MNKIIAILLIIFSLSTYGECINEINNEKDLLLSNICTYDYTTVATINSVTLRNKYNPLTYLKNHRIYTIEATVKENIKGENTGHLCFIQWREEPFDNIHEMENKLYIISFNKGTKCYVIDVGSILESNDELLQIARNANIN